jgi:hypothetical protein
MDIAIKPESHIIYRVPQGGEDEKLSFVGRRKFDRGEKIFPMKRESWKTTQHMSR